MKGARQKRAAVKRSIPAKLRKNAVSKKLTVVFPVHGDELKARIGAPFEPMDFRQLIARAKQKNPAKVDQAFKNIVAKTTTKQINELLSAMRIKRKDPIDYRRAFSTLAIALLGVGQVVWTPERNRRRGWTADDEVNLFWLVHDLTAREGASEREAIKQIVSDSFLISWFPYRPQELKRPAQLSDAARRAGALWQAWNKAKRRKDEILSRGPPKAFQSMFGGTLGHWEAKLIALDTEAALPKTGKNRRR